MERNEIAQFPILEFHKVYDIIRVHAVSIDIHTAKVRLDDINDFRDISFVGITGLSRIRSPTGNLAFVFA